jgi:sugar lactone lactonase YvrE
MILPSAITINKNGTFYVSDRYNHGISVLSSAGANLSVYAGCTGPNVVNGYRLGRAKFSNPTGSAFDSDNNLYIAETGSHRIRRIASDGTVSILAGAGVGAFADGIGTVSRFHSPQGITRVNDTLFIADTNNNRIRGLSFNGTSFTVAGNGTASSVDGIGTSATFNRPIGITADANGILYVTASHVIRAVFPNRTVVTLAGATSAGYVNAQGRSARFNSPSGLALTSNGDLIIADSLNHAIRRVTRSGKVSRVAGANGVGYIDGTVSLARFNYPIGIAIDASDTVYVSDYWNHAVRKVFFNGTVGTFLDPGFGYKNGVLLEAKFDHPSGMTMDPNGRLIVSDTNTNTIRRISFAENRVETVAGIGQLSGRVDGDAPTSRFRSPVGVAVDEETGNIYVSDNFCAIRRIEPTGIVSSFAGSTSTGFVNGVGNQARFNNPQGLAVVKDTLFVADFRNHAIRQISIVNKSVSTFVGGRGGATDGLGTVATFRFISDIIWSANDQIFYLTDTGNHRIRTITPQGNVSFLAGLTAGYLDGIGSLARFNSPRSLALDGQGIAYVTDYLNRAVRKVSPSGNVTTLVRGKGFGNFYEWPRNFSLFNPQAISIDQSGAVYVTDAHSFIWSFVCPSSITSIVPEEELIEVPIIEPPIDPWDDVAYEEPPEPPVVTSTSTRNMKTTKKSASISATSAKRTSSPKNTKANTDSPQSWLDKTVLNLPVTVFLIISIGVFVIFLIVLGTGIFWFRRRNGLRRNKRHNRYDAVITNMDSNTTRSFIVPTDKRHSEW